jgi:hypothetical protein
LHSKLRPLPGQTSPDTTGGLAAGRGPPINQGWLEPDRQCFRCFLIWPLLASAFVGATGGTATSAVAHIARVESRIASLLMRRLLGIPYSETCSGPVYSSLKKI